MKITVSFIWMPFLEASLLFKVAKLKQISSEYKCFFQKQRRWKYNLQVFMLRIFFISNEVTQCPFTGWPLQLFTRYWLLLLWRTHRHKSKKGNKILLQWWPVNCFLKTFIFVITWKLLQLLCWFLAYK